MLRVVFNTCTVSTLKPIAGEDTRQFVNLSQPAISRTRNCLDDLSNLAELLRNKFKSMQMVACIPATDTKWSSAIPQSKLVSKDAAS